MIARNPQRKSDDRAIVGGNSVEGSDDCGLLHRRCWCVVIVGVAAGASMTGFA